jgi:hypothetical protein
LNSTQVSGDMRTVVRLLGIAGAAVFALGCVGTIDGGPVSLEIRSPAPGAAFVRDQIGRLGERVAAVDVDVAAGGLAAVELWAGDLLVGDGGLAEIPLTGDVALEARGIGRGGDVVLVAAVDLTIDDPAIADCAGWLDLFGLDWQPGPALQGVAEPVRVQMPLVGVDYRYVVNAEPRADLLADCSLIRALAESAGILRRRDVVELADIGIYNYRCIGGGTPPDCPSGVSQHAYATAIDVAGYTDAAGTFYSVNDDWIIDPDGGATCAAATDGDKDSFLHEIICAQKAAGVWNIVLTPNYNAAHRNHFHVDLSPGSDFIERAPAPAVDLGPDLH